MTNPTPPLSSCCGAEIKGTCDEEMYCWEICDKCLKPITPAPQEEKIVAVLNPPMDWLRKRMRGEDADTPAPQK